MVIPKLFSCESITPEVLEQQQLYLYGLGSCEVGLGPVVKTGLFNIIQMPKKIKRPKNITSSALPLQKSLMKAIDCLDAQIQEANCEKSAELQSKRSRFYRLADLLQLC